MKLWLLINNGNGGYDTYDSAVVVAKTEKDAKRIYPDDFCVYSEEHSKFVFQYASGEIEVDYDGHSWADSPNKVFVEYLGEAGTLYEEGQVILASYNAG